MLDVGSQIGLNVKAIRALGNKVVGVEPDKEAYTFAVSKTYLNAQEDYCCCVQELPKELNNQFDLATIFLFNIPRDEYHAVFKRISMLLKPTGKLLIGTEVEEYTRLPENDNQKQSLRPALLDYFGVVYRNAVTDQRDNSQRFIIVCTDPKKLEASNSPTLNI